MVLKVLLNLGLVSIPYFVWGSYDTRTPKMVLATAIALTLGLVTLYQGKLKAFSNKWLFFLIAFIPISILLAPKVKITLFDISIGSFWIWQPLFYIMVFALMLISVASIEFSKRDINRMFMCMIWSGFVMSLYVCLQAMNIDQFFGITNASQTKAGLTGTLGHPTVVASYIAIIIPIALYMKKRIKALVMIVAVCLTWGKVALVAMIVSLLFYFSTKGKRSFIVGCIILTMMASTLTISYFTKAKVYTYIQNESSGRFQFWKQLVVDLKSPIKEGEDKGYFITGMGMGNFLYTYHVKHPTKTNRIFQAHNDYLELLYNTGIIGLVLFLCSIGYMLKTNFSFSALSDGKVDRYRMCLLSSFICIAICAGGLFVWQLAAHIFYTIVIAGLLHNKGGVT